MGHGRSEDGVGVWAVPRAWADRCRALLERIAGHPVPKPTDRYWFCLGAAPLQLLVVQLVSGVLLAMHYRPSAAEAYESTRLIAEELSYGWLVRGVHHWSAVLLVATAALHQLRVWVSGAYRAPRQGLWLGGCGLLVCMVAACFTGDALAGDQRGFWSLVVGANLVAELPALGPQIARLLLAGQQPSTATLPRLFAWHAVVLPAVAVGLCALHLAWVRVHGPAALDQDHETSEGRSTRFWPDQLRTDLMVGLALLVVVTILATVDPGGLGPPADPLRTPQPLQPRWYALPVVGWVRLWPARAAATGIALAMLGMCGWPWLDRRLRASRLARRLGVHDRAPQLGAVAVAMVLALGIWEAWAH